MHFKGSDAIAMHMHACHVLAQPLGCSHCRLPWAEGRGSLVDAHTVEIKGIHGSTKRVTAKNILVAVGGYPNKLPIEGAVGLLRNKSLPRLARQGAGVLTAVMGTVTKAFPC